MNQDETNQKEESNKEENKEEKFEETQEEEKELSLIEEARQLNEDNKKTLEQMKSERKKLETLYSDSLIAGKSMFSQTPTKTKEEEYKERTEERYKGMGFSPLNSNV